ncbi:MAG: M23 family metallopeptidase, partial [Cutibacterium sp.]|nr:M23 family metallopeptidase [Cutibacterium sp.]
VEAARDMIGKAWGKIKGFFSSVGNWVRGAWNSSWSTVKGIMVRPIHAARDAIHTALGKIRSFFDGTKNAIKKSWDGLRGIMSAPVRWVADRVINPMVRSYNTLAGKVGMGKKLTEWSFKGFRTGGYTGHMGVDQAAGIVHGQEYVLTAEETHRLGGPGGVEAWKRVALGRGYRRGGYVWPTTSRRLSPNYRRHSGVDIPVPTGTPLFATEDGTVSYVGTGRGYGRAIFLNGADGVPWVYGHTLRATVATGTRVRRGQQIGLSDNTGHSTGPHLHIEAARGRFAQPSNRAYTLGLLGGSMSPAGGLGLPATGDGEGYFDPLGWLKGKIAGPLGRLKELGSGFGQVVKGMATSIGDGMLGAAGRWAKDMASRAWDSVAAGAGKGLALVKGAGRIARWAPFVERALRVSGIGGGPLDVALWLKQIKTESDGNPRLV